MNIKENQKFKSTHKAIMEAVLALLQTKNIKQVTVSEICRMVHINRSTFYEHFLDAYDVLEKIAEEITEEASKAMPNTGREPQREDFLALFEHIKKHKDFFTLYFKQGLPLDIQERFFHRSPPPPQPEDLMASGVPTDVQAGYRFAMGTAVFDAMIRHWLERDCTETPEELYEMLYSHFMRR